MKNKTYNNLGMEVPAGRPKIPKGLSKEARQEWKRIVSAMEEINNISPVFGASIECYIDLWQIRQDLYAAVSKDGAVYKDARGVFRIHPGVSTGQRFDRAIKRDLKSFGLK